MKTQIWQRVLAAGDLDQFGDPADTADQRIVPFLEIDFWFGRASRRRCDAGEALLKPRSQLVGAPGGADHGADHADHRQNAGQVALVEDMHVDAGAHEILDDVGLQVGEGEHEIRLECQDFWDIRRDESGHARFFAAHLRRPHRIAGDPDDAVLLAEQIERLDRFLGQADDAMGREVAHGRCMQDRRPLVTAAITSEVIA